MSRWYQKFGTAEFPVRQSALNSIASQNGCAKRFFFETEQQLAGDAPPEREHWRRVFGVAVHAVIERALSKPPVWDQLVGIYLPSSANRPADAPPNWCPRPLRVRIDETLREELTRAANGQPIEWMGEDPETEIAAGVDMVIGALRTVVERARRIVAVEAPFRVQLDEYHLEGTIDLLYEPIDQPQGTVALADFKTGERKLAQVVLDFGYQTSTYAHAVAEGEIFPGTERAFRIGAFPTSIHIVHLRDAVPYVRGPKKGSLRGPIWYAARRAPDDIARLRVSLRDVIGTVRMGRRLEAIGEQCAWCPFRGPCLGDGYQLPPAEARQLERALDGIDLGDVLPDVA